MGYAIGSIDTVSIIGTIFGDTQFKQMTVFAALFLIGSVLVTSYAVKERVLITARWVLHLLFAYHANSTRDSDDKPGAIQVASELIKTTMDLPPRIQAICWAQFWAWIGMFDSCFCAIADRLGWFPFLFYSTTWVGETYFRYEVPKDSAQWDDILGEVGRVGSLSLVVFSAITFISSVVLPFCVQPPDSKRTRFTPRPPPGIAAFLKRITAVRPDLQMAWLISHCMFAATMIFAPFARSRAVATLLVAVCGIPWAISGWAPFAFMGVEINRLAMGIPSPSRSGVTMITSASVRERAAESELDVLRLNHQDAESDTDEEAGAGASSPNTSSTGELAGIYLGVLNVYTTLPQFVGTFISWIVFSVLEPGSRKRDEAESPDSDSNSDSRWMNLDGDSPNAIAVCLFVGAISTLVAAEATRRLRYVR